MRLSPILLLLPALAVAEDQKSFLDIAKGWFEQAKAYVPAAVPTALSSALPSISPIDAGASAVAASKVEKININNYKRKLAPRPEGPTEWMVMVTGKNETCLGGCESANLRWNESVPLLSAIANPPHLGYLDCDKEQILCAVWMAGVPSIWHFTVPQATRGATTQAPGQASGPTHLHIKYLNSTTVSATDILRIQTEKTYRDEEEYTGFLHPIDGFVAKYGLTQPFGYVMWFFGTTPSWMLMIGLSFISRQIMSRRMSRGLPAVPPPKRD